MAWIYFNPNPSGKAVGDCVIRAISKITDIDWDKCYMELVLQGYMMKDMPSANYVWGAYLSAKGFKRYIIPNTCPDCYTVRDFCEEHPRGTFLLGTGTHVVTVSDGHYFDSWDSGDEIPIYYWVKEV